MWHDKFIKPVQLRNLRAEKDRKVTWTELFYDLVFVVVIAELSHNLFKHTSIIGILQFCLLFIAVWYGWLANIFYCDRFDTDSPLHRFFYVIQMLFVACMAAHAHLAFSAEGSVFIWLYVLFRGVILLQYVSVYLQIKSARSVVNKYIYFYSIIILLWLISLCFPFQIRFYFWIIAILFDMTMPLWIRKTLLIEVTH